MASAMDFLSKYIQMLYYILTYNSSRISFNYKLNCSKLLTAVVIEGLGIFLTFKLNLNVHINYVSKKARKVFSQVVRNCKSFYNTFIFFSCMPHQKLAAVT